MRRRAQRPACLAAGVWRDAEAFLAHRCFDRFTPGPGAPEARARVAEWRRAVSATLHGATAGRPKRRRPA